MPVRNAEISAMFDPTAELLEIQDENQFRVRAYRRVTQATETAGNGGRLSHIDDGRAAERGYEPI